MKFFSIVCLLSLVVVTKGRAQTNAFSYQGQLSAGGAPVTGAFDLRFSLHDTPSQTNQIGGVITNRPVGVTNGVFTVFLDFGASPFLAGSNRWLQIGVRPFGDTNAYVVLMPRQPLLSAPSAIRADYALAAGSADAAAKLSSPLAATNVVGIVPDANLSTNIARLNSNAVFSGSVTAVQFNGSGAGLTSLPAGNLTGTFQDSVIPANIARLNSSATFAGTVTAPLFNGNGSGLTNVPGRIFDTIATGSAIQAWPNTGYLATNPSTPVVVTLPASIKVGETVRVSGSGSGGWVIAQNAGQVILAANLADNLGLSFALRETNRAWKAIASSEDGSKLVAVVNGGQIYTSTNYGMSWTARNSNRSWQGVASSADGTKLVAVVSGGQIYTSTDSGVNWNPRENNRSWTGVASSVDGARLVACVNGGQIYTSPDSGATWTPRDSSRNWAAVASSSTGSNLVAAVNGGQIYTSTSAGVGWTARDSVRTWSAVASSADGSRLVATVKSTSSNGRIFLSTDAGLNWALAGPDSANREWTSVASSSDGSTIVACYNLGTFFLSKNSGSSWVTPNSSLSLGWTGVTVSGDGSTAAAVASSQPIYVNSAPSTTPGTAGYLSGTRLSAVELQYIGDGQFMPISQIGAVRAH